MITLAVLSNIGVKSGLAVKCLFTSELVVKVLLEKKDSNIVFDYD